MNISYNVVCTCLTISVLKRITKMQQTGPRNEIILKFQSLAANIVSHSSSLSLSCLLSIIISLL